MEAEFGEPPYPIHQDEASSDPKRLEGTLIAMPGQRRLVQVYRLTTQKFANGRLGTPDQTGLLFRDADSFRTVGKMILPGLPLVANIDLNGEWIHEVDNSSGLLFLAYSPPSGPFLPSRSFGVWVIDAVSLTLKADIELPVNTLNQQQMRILGITYVPADRRLYAVLQVGSVTILTALRVDGSKPAEVWTRTIRSCRGTSPVQTPGSRGSHAVVRPPGDYLYVPCNLSQTTAGVVRLRMQELEASQTPTEEVAAGPGGAFGIFADPGGGRIYFPVYQQTSTEVWVFDVPSMAFVSVLALQPARVTEGDFGLGLEEATGRFFFLSSHYGVSWVDGRLNPVPQAVVHPVTAARGSVRMVMDTPTGRLFVLPCVSGGCSKGNERDYAVYRVQRPLPVPPPPNPDRGTIDHVEVSGLTEVAGVTRGGGYGVRELLANGVSGAAIPAASEAPTLARTVNSYCGFSDRELVGGAILKAERTEGVGGVLRASSLETDSRTKLDLGTPSRCEIYVKQLGGGSDVFPGIFRTIPAAREPFDQIAGRPWPYQPAECSGSDNKAQTGEPKVGEATVDCSADGGRSSIASAYATLGGAEIGAERVSSEVRLTKVSPTGVSAMTVSTARDVTIGPTVHIGEITTIAASRAAGRPGTAKGEFVRRISDVRMPGFQCTQQCNPEEVRDRLNLLFGGRVQFRLPQPDPILMKGSPGGAIAAVQKSQFQVASDTTLVGDDSMAIAGLELVVFNDHSQWGRSRQIYQFAGSTSAATYNISLAGFGPGSLTTLIGSDEGGDFLDSADSSLLSGAEEKATGRQGVLERLKDFFRRLREGFLLLMNNPRQALAMLTAWLLFAGPIFLWGRRHLLRTVA